MSAEVREPSAKYLVSRDFKQTEIGPIPTDWIVEPLGKRATFRTGPFGSALHKSDYVTDGTPIINPMHIVDGLIVPTVRMTVTDHAARMLSDFCVKPGEIVIGRRGDMGRCAVVGEKNAGWICGTGSMIIRPERTNADFLQRVLSSPKVVGAIEDAAVGTTMVNLNQGTLANLKIQFPPRNEQDAIATALSDVDALIAGLEKLIAKKRDLKQAAMQQLLTGQTRLPGFSGAWSVKRLGDHFSILKNGVNSRAELSVEGGVAYLHYGDIHGSKSLFLNPQKTTMPTLPLAKAKDLDRLQSGDLVFADASEDLDGVGKSVEVQGSDVLDLVSGQHTIAIRFDKTVLADGFKAYLQFFPAFSAHLYKLAAGTKVYATNRSQIASAEIKLPEVDEQRAIGLY
jgi:type I restriction enzyme S subunit